MTIRRPPIQRPLDGMLVLDLGQIYNGPYCGLQLGFMGARVHKINPRLVYGGSSGFGLDGPYRDLAAMDVTIQAMSGITNATGDADGPPTKAGAAVCDFLAGIHLCAGILGALVQRERTGQGQRVEVAMHEAAVIALASALGAVMDGDDSVPHRTGNRHPALAMAPYNTYPCSDGYVAIFTSAERHWHSMCRLLGRPELLENPTYSTTPGRAKHMAEIDDIISAWTIERSKDEILKLLNEAHVPCAPVKTAREVAYD